jgi:chromosome segregation ATPase
MFAKRSKQSSQQQSPTDDGSQTAQSGSESRDATIERLERELEEQRDAAKRLQEALDAATFKVEILEKSYAKQLAEARDKRAALEADLKEKEDILAGLGDGHEHTLRELNDAVAVIQVLKGEVVQLRNLIAQGGHRQTKNDPPTRARLAVGDTSDGTINALISNAGWVDRRKPAVGTGQATATVESEPAPPQEEMIAPDLVFTAKDKENDDER